MTIHQFPRRRIGGTRNSGLFWLLPKDQQAERIRVLARSFSAETVASICRKPISEVTAIIEGNR